MNEIAFDVHRIGRTNFIEPVVLTRTVREGKKRESPWPCEECGQSIHVGDIYWYNDEDTRYCNACVDIDEIPDKELERYYKVM
jgi:hypothetical protein